MAQKIAIVDYGAGNLRSVAKGIETAARDAGGEAQILVTDSPQVVAGADRIVLPGVGAFGQCAAALRSIEGMVEMLDRQVNGKGRPFLGICVGMQLMAGSGEERGAHAGLAWISGEVVKLDPSDPRLKIPHMGWSAISQRLSGLKHPVLGALEDNGEAYFVHSYQFRPECGAHQLATCDYGGTVTAVVGRDTMIGTQFHPEKSQSYGLRFLRAFLDWKP
ncbi:MAG: imidazole glycerol phosphate synthase subunit HisH [Pacificimonas sp.]|jgi:glutamine amidotransferase|nr:imidazole glycerol phosphate synthase subunit HisH [Pacificimonas sp.]